MIIPDVTPATPPGETRVRPSDATDDEAIKVHGRANHRDPAGAGRGCCDGGAVPQARGKCGDFLQMEGQFGGLEVSEAKRLRALESEKRPAETDAGRGHAR